MKPIIAIVGRPNVGKSTLFNRIIGTHKALTLDEPGVTRDRHYGNAEWDGHEFILVDTGGFPSKKSRTSLEIKIRDQIETALKEAEAIVFVMDGREGLAFEDREIHLALRRLGQSGQKVFYLINKIDGADHRDKLTDFYDLGTEIFPISAEHGYGISDFLDALVKALVFPKEGPEKGLGKTVRIALIGRPNTGKSSLLNRLLGEPRSIVHEDPGTTRDVVDTLIEVEGEKYQVLDTAGIRRRSESVSRLERFSVLHSFKSIEQSHVCLLLLDASSYGGALSKSVASDHGMMLKQDAHIAGYCKKAGKILIVLWNKWDLIGDSKDHRKEYTRIGEEGLKFVAEAPIFFISAKTGFGCSRIWKEIRSLVHHSRKKASTRDVNEVLQNLVESHNPPVYRGKPVKFLYATQIKNSPPTFLIFTSDPKGVHFSFERYLMNGFRDALGLGGVPVRLMFRKKR